MQRIFPCPLGTGETPQPQCCNCGYPQRISTISGPELDNCDVNLPKKCEDNDSSTKSRKLFADFCDNTSIHGVKYIGGANQGTIDRAWWILSFLISIILCTYLIRNLWNKWEDTPVFVSFSEHSTPVWEIPFPAGETNYKVKETTNSNKYKTPIPVTICPETKARKDMFNYTDIYHRIEQAIMNGTEPDLTVDE